MSPFSRAASRTLSGPSARGYSSHIPRTPPRDREWAEVTTPTTSQGRCLTVGSDGLPGKLTGRALLRTQPGRRPRRVPVAVHDRPRPYAAGRGRPCLSSVTLSNRLGMVQPGLGPAKVRRRQTGCCPQNRVVCPNDWQKLWASPRVPGRKPPNLSLCSRRKGRKKWPRAVCPAPQSKGSSQGCAVTVGVSGSESGGWTEGGLGWQDGGREAPTFPEEYFWSDVIRGPNQGVRQAPLMLLPGSLLQRLQPVPATTVGHVAPQVPGLHAVLSDVAPCQPGIGWENKRTRTR